MSLVEFVIDKLDDLKGTEIVHFDVKGKSCKKAGYETFGEEGRNTADWIVVDLGQTIVHIMQRDAREMYQLEKLWE